MSVDCRGSRHDGAAPGAAVGHSARVTIDPDRHKAVIFDLDGVVTRTATVHAEAWRRLFDDYLEDVGRRTGRSLAPFDIASDYRAYLDGKQRYDGVRDFLASRGITLPWGRSDNPPDRETVCGLGNRKNTYFLKHLTEHGVESYPTTVALLERLRRRGVRTAIISASKNCAAVLDAAKVRDLFDAKVDGLDAEREGFAGKPAPDIFVRAASALRVPVDMGVVVEDARAGVAAGRAGGFALVIGVDRTGDAEGLLASGADVVVEDLGMVEIDGPAPPLPSALDWFDRLMAGFGARRPAVFLDYDGTLTPIVPRPEDALIDDNVRAILRRLAEQCAVAIVSGRDLRDVRDKVGVPGLVYAGSHGFDIETPQGARQIGTEALPALDEAERLLAERLGGIAGAQVERKRFAIAVHTRRVADADVPAVEDATREIAARFGALRVTGGKRILELRPNIEWDKGRAVLSLIEELGLSAERYVPVYVGDDLTDEDAFRALRGGLGVGIVVAPEVVETAAAYRLDSVPQAHAFLDRLAVRLASG